MTMVIDTQGRHYGGMSYDPMYPATMHTSPQFNDPWSHQPSSAATSFPPLSKTDGLRTGMPMSYSHMTPASTSMTSGSNITGLGYGTDSLSLAQDIPRSTYADQQYGSPATTNNSYPASYSSMNGYAHSLHSQQQQQQQHRRMSEATDSSRAATASFADLDASRGMLALSHQSIQDLTPRNIYEARQQRSSTDSYGFPPSTSGHSSISNESGRGYPYYASSIASIGDSATDYSSAASDAGYDSIANSRTLPRPSQLMGAPMMPPAPQSMMGQFSSKLSANTQKKHKCKVCDKRFTRPSSLQTHMYSHTGEKPFACDVDGCGRHFSVVSNLRRHKKVHKGESAGSPHSDHDD